MINTDFEAGAWPEDIQKWAQRAEAGALAARGIAPDLYDINLLLTNDAEIRALNANFRDKDKATNVLSWPAYRLAPEQPGGEPMSPPAPKILDPEWREELGDIALAYETTHNEATTRNISLEAHASHLIVHAILHLLGFDHETDADAQKMEQLESRIMAEMGFDDPYALDIAAD